MNDLIAEFLAKREITRVPQGARTMTNRQLRDVIGYQPDEVIMTHYHAVLLDECGDEFGADVTATSREAARTKLRDMYPENRGIIQIESPDDTDARERRMHERNGLFFGRDYE